MAIERQAKRQVLLITARPEVRGALMEHLASADLHLTTADSSSAAWHRIFENSLHAIVIDLTGVNGSEVWNLCRASAELSSAPVIGLVRRNDDLTRVQAFAYGADQCFVSPGGLAELVAYLMAHQVYRGQPRPAELRESVPEMPSLVIDLDRRRVFLNRRPVSLSRIEFALLLLMAKRGGDVVETGEIRQTLWKSRSRSLSPGMVKQYIWRLRCKIEPDKDHPLYLETVRGLGYCLHHSSVIPDSSCSAASR